MARVMGAAVLVLAIGAGVAPACGAGATTATSGPASAPATPQPDRASSAFVTPAEFQQIRKGMPRDRVERVFQDRRSRLAAGGAGGYVRSYKACDGQHAAWVEYEVIWHDRKVVGARFNGFKRWTAAR